VRPPPDLPTPRRPCSPADGGGAAATATGWSLALHGGCGDIDPGMPDASRDAFLAGLAAALRLGADLLAAGTPALDTVEAVVVALEEDPLFNAGRGAVLTHDGTAELDAAIMDGDRGAAGAVAVVRTVRNPVRLARQVMARSPHVFLAGAGAEAFAAEVGVERVPNAWFETPLRRGQLDRELAAERELGAPVTDGVPGTVGAVARDLRGRLAAATSTGGRSNKRPGRIGDSPVIGAGTWADRVCAVSATGKGEELLRHAVCARVALRMAYAGDTLQQAVDAVVRGLLRPADGGVIAVGSDGSLALEYNTRGMFRGAANAAGRFEVAIWS
jgi:beta-aspartyl-peptidase (threonine type)